MLVRRRRHPEEMLRSYATHYNEARPHRGLDLRTPRPLPKSLPRTAEENGFEGATCWGGLIHEYELAA
jgi:putative transposase